MPAKTLKDINAANKRTWTKDADRLSVGDRVEKGGKKGKVVEVYPEGDKLKVAVKFDDGTESSGFAAEFKRTQ